jgi:hypothetical protein
MRRFHTSIPWFGESTAILREEITVLPPYIGEQIMLSGGRVVRVTDMSVATKQIDAYRRRSYWTVQLQIEPVA